MLRSKSGKAEAHFARAVVAARYRTGGETLGQKVVTFRLQNLLEVVAEQAITLVDGLRKNGFAPPFGPRW